ncbi:hypothetical protein GCM10025734_58520 [Kitasatospora paranensis]
MPVLVGEWGPPSARTPGNAALIDRQVAAMQAFATGWTMWYWCLGDGGYCALGPDGRPAAGDGPAFGPYPVATAGVPLAQSFRADRFTLEFTSGARGGVSELTLPVGSFPHGVRVSLTGAGRTVTDVRQPTADRAGTVRVRLPDTRPGSRVTVTLTG